MSLYNPEAYDAHVTLMYSDENMWWRMCRRIVRPDSGPYRRVDSEDLLGQRYGRECPVGDPLLAYLDDY